MSLGLNNGSDEAHHGEGITDSKRKEVHDLLVHILEQANIAACSVRSDYEAEVEAQ